MVKSDLLAIEGGEPVVPAGAHRRWPDIVPADHEAVRRVLDSGELWGAHGTEVTALQDEYARYSGAQYVLAVNSGTAALHCALVAAGVNAGDEVIVPAFSFVATPMSVLHAGARPVFCDIDPSTFNIDPREAEKLVTERTSAIMPVHMNGLPADMKALRDIAQRHGLAIIEDAAQAHGSTYLGEPVGTMGVAGAFSLNGAKNLSAGEGGLFVTNDEGVFTAARRLAIFGEDTPRPKAGEVRAFWSRGIGWNYRIHEITAALARSQLKRLDAYNAQARANAAVLTKGLAGIRGIIPPQVPDGLESSFFRYRVCFRPSEFGWEGSDTEFRDRFLFALRAEGVAVSTWQLHPLPAQPVFRRDRYQAWRPEVDQLPLKPWDPGQYPETTRILEQSFVLGPDQEPLQVQSEDVMARYVEAFEKIVHRMGSVLSAEYQPVRVTPPIPQEEL
ncbi:DegT/DnrJ/EryC1/StrS family aminotransferase [Amycolatopsis sp. AA4]|uniref:DegT/DnrJ/EryC1/StrS family aminotransferase n=1 Tax=Actinomycetes TaxID=1760 RepID=UPI0001B56571|nr:MULTISPECIES: DegT/DnrJ/EryC1/StrS family aminotransferase [Actinomycetes]ATY11243.1 DegT/DnrJ/EryC1/StrS family aminotransferase [Amycolatopsis sp. AA4]EFL06830.1 UDP-4-keto-6-deoxy-N-acetylglucosamine 4-aminotransferase [Streptomyces sp. AA4]